MKRTNQQCRTTVRGAAIAAVLLTSVMASQAAVITLTGGDLGEGFSPQQVPVYAYNLYESHFSEPTPAPQTIQGITFQPFKLDTPPAGFSLSGNFSNGYLTQTSPDIGATADDNALEVVMATAAYAAFPGAWTLHMGNLTAGKTYQVDLFVLNVFDSRTENFTFNGGQPNVFPTTISTYYDVRENVVADGSGEIVVRLFNDGSLPFLSAFAVTEVAPEPSTILLLGVGGLLAWRRRGRQV